MKKSLLAAVLLIFIFQSGYSADEVLQKIGLSIDSKSPGYKIELILEKIVLSVAVSNSKVHIYSADKADLEYTGISELNGKVLLKAVKKAGYYQIELYQAGQDKETVLFDDTVRLYLNKFGDTVYDIAQEIIREIGKQYPPKPIRELTTINIVRVKLSEYESQNGYWTVGVIPAYDILKMNIGLKTPSGNNNMSKSLNNNGGSLTVEGIYRCQQWNFILGAGAARGGWSETGFTGTFNEISLNAVAGYGLFGSLFIVGLDSTLNLCNFTTDFTNYNISSFNTLVVPNISIRNLQINMFIQVNISKDYYITFAAGPPIPLDFFNQVRLDFNKGVYSANSNIIIPASMIFGLPQIKLSLNFRLFPSWWVRVYYQIYGPSLNNNNNGSSSPVPVDSTGTFTLDMFNYNKTRIGLGMYYAF